MDRFPSDEDINIPPRSRVLIWHIACATQVILYVNTFLIWNGITRMIGPEAAQFVPFILLAIVLAVAMSAIRRVGSVHWPMLILGIGIAVLSVFLSDPAFPAKRVHVPQYIVLAVLLRRALVSDIRHDPGLWIASTALAALYGIHDEFLQGFHPDRTFGLRDISINSLSALSGSLTAAALGLFNQRATGSRLETGIPTMVSLLVVIIGAFLLILPLEGFRDQAIPLWSILPLLAAGATIALVGSSRIARSCAFRVFICIAFSLLIYPLASHVPPFHFH